MTSSWWPKSSRKPVPLGLRHRCRPPVVEVLEDRTVPATFTVTNLADDGPGSLRQAVADANGASDPDAIVFQAGLTGTITLTSGQLNVTQPVTISGPGPGALTISGNNASRIFLVSDGSTVANTFAFSGLTLTQGLATDSNRGGAIEVANEDLTLTDVVVDNNSAQQGGGVFVNPNGRLSLLNSRVSNNRATVFSGGGLFLGTNSATVIRNSTISGNTVVGLFSSGGGIFLNDGAFLAIESSTISANQAILNGGGLFSSVRSTLVVRNCTVSGNSALSGAGISTASASLTVENSTISGNKASGAGGGILMTGGGPIGVPIWAIRNSTIAFNTADSDNSGGGTGGGIVIFDPFLTLQSTIVAENVRGTAGPHDDIVGNVSAASLLNLIGVDTGLVGIINGTNGNQVGTAAVPLNPVLGPLTDNGGPTQTHALLAGSPAINAGFNFSGQATDQRGDSFARSFAATDIGAFELQPPPLPPLPSLPAVEILVKRVRLRTRVEVVVGGSLKRRFFPFRKHKGRVQVLKVDVNGDGLLDVVARATLNGKKRTRTFTT